MIKRVAASRGRWFPVEVIEATPKQLRAGALQYTAVAYLGDNVSVDGSADSIEEAVDVVAGLI